MWTRHFPRSASDGYGDSVFDLDSIDVEEIATALADQNDYDHRWLLDPTTGAVVFWTSDTGIDGQTPVDLDDLDLITIEPLPSHVWYEDMVDFAEQLGDEQAGRRLSRAIAGRGAFRMFRDELHQEYPELVPVWNAFRDARAHRRAVEWLADNLLITDDAAAQYLDQHPEPTVQSPSRRRSAPRAGRQERIHSAKHNPATLPGPAVTIEVAAHDDIPAFLASAEALVATDAGQYDAGATDLDWAAKTGLAYCTALLASDDNLVLLARSEIRTPDEDNGILGHLVARLSGPGSVHPIRVAEVESIHVYAEHRGHGIGDELMTAFLAWAASKGAHRVSVTAYAANEGAQRFYARHGFGLRSVILDHDLDNR